MKKIILYIASSLDGYIATPDHSIAWLEQLENPDGNDYGYMDFLNGIDTLIMGRKTYDIIRSFDLEWPYGNCETFILSSNTNLEIDTPGTNLFSGDITGLLKTLRSAEGDKNIWIVGGGKTIDTLMQSGGIDEIRLFTAPILLGEGIRLFPESPNQKILLLEEHQRYPSGMLYTRYTLKNA